MKNIISLLFREHKWITHASQQTMASSHVFGMGGVIKSFCLFHRSSLVPIHQSNEAFVNPQGTNLPSLLFVASWGCYNETVFFPQLLLYLWLLHQHLRFVETWRLFFLTTISLRKYLDLEPEPLMLGRSKQHRWSLSLATCLKIEFLDGNKSTKASLYRCYVMVCYIY